MGWKNGPYWLKGSIVGSYIGLTIGIIIYFLFELRELSLLSYPLSKYIAVALIPILGLNFFSVFIVSIILLLIESILIGALIGWIYGKVKRR